LLQNAKSALQTESGLLKKNINNSSKDSGAAQNETNQIPQCLECLSELKRSGVVIGTAERMSKAEPFIS
jgi:hypothetical protein